MLQRRHDLPDRLLLDGDNYHRLNPEAPIISFTHLEVRDPLFTILKANQVLGDRKVALIVRHPIDTAVSLYHHDNSREDNEEYRNMAKTSLDDFVRAQIPIIVDFMNRWIHGIITPAKLLILRYEDLHRDATSELKLLLDFAELRFSDAEISEALAFATFDNMRELERNSFFLGGRLRPTDPDEPESYKVRQGKVGGYIEVLAVSTCRQLERYIETTLSKTFGYHAAAAQNARSTA